jgi:putative hydrolase of the HAD superfamily
VSPNLCAVIFDLDGTLYVNIELARQIHQTACRFLAGSFGVSAEEADRRIKEAKSELARETGLESSLSAACLHLSGDLPALHRHFAEEIDPAPLLTPDERVIALLERLGRDFGLYVYTNNNRPLAERILAAIGLGNHFQGIFSIEDSWRPKPDRTALDQVLTAIGTTPAETLFVGDRYDIDLRLPQSLGSRIYLSRSVDELLALEQVIREESQ